MMLSRYVALLAFALWSPATAQTIETTADGHFQTLRSDLIVRTEDWPALRQRVLDAWGLAEVPEIPFAEVGALGSGARDAFTSRSGTLEILSLMTPPEDDAILYALGELYTDIDGADIDAFQEGVVIEVTNRAGASGEIVVYFFALARAQGAGAPPLTQPAPEMTVLNQTLRPAMPERSNLVAEAPSSRGGWVYRYETEASPAVMFAQFLEKLALLDYRVEVRDLQGAMAIFATGPLYEVFILIEPQLSDGSVMVTIVIDSF